MGYCWQAVCIFTIALHLCIASCTDFVNTVRMIRNRLCWIVFGFGLALSFFSGCVHHGESASKIAPNMLNEVVSSWVEVIPESRSYTKAAALNTLQSLSGRFTDGNTGSAYSLWQAEEGGLKIEIRGSRIATEKQLGGGLFPISSGIKYEERFILGWVVDSPIVEYATPEIELTESVETNKYVLSAELPYKAIKGMALHVAPDSSGQSALIVDVEGGGWVLLIANSSEDVQLLHAALATLRQG